MRYLVPITPGLDVDEVLIVLVSGEGEGWVDLANAGGADHFLVGPKMEAILPVP
jgi:hypothetical protein